MLTRQQLIEFFGQQPRRVHFVGIGGCGMSGLARILAQQGHRVTGSDLSSNGESVPLRALGIPVHLGHAATHVPRDIELLVYTSAVNAENPELRAASSRQIPTVQRGRLLTALMNHRTNIAVAGTHGKTTTTAMIALVLQQSGVAPGFCVGAQVPVLGTNAQAGRGDIFVAEADESDGTLLGFTPEISVCLNIEPEHLDYHGSMERLREAFAGLFRSTLRAVYYCADCEASAQLARPIRGAISFGLSPQADYHARNIEPTACGSRFTVACRDREIGVVELQIPGQQNVVNALAAFAVADQVGVPVAQIAEALGQFTGAKRRFERKFAGDGIVVVDDYAHHPTEIRATIAAARTLRPGRLVVAFQPHRYTRTQALRDQFGSAFREADKIFLTDVYAASESPIPGVTGRTILEAVLADGAADVAYEPSVANLAQRLRLVAQPGDLILLMGAGDIYQTAGALAQLLERDARSNNETSTHSTTHRERRAA